MIKKTKRELALDFFQNFMDEGTSEDEARVWVSQESYIEELKPVYDMIGKMSKNEIMIQCFQDKKQYDKIMNWFDNFNKKLNEEE